MAILRIAFAFILQPTQVCLDDNIIGLSHLLLCNGDILVNTKFSLAFF